MTASVGAPERQASGAGWMTKKWAGLPVWGWALGGGLAVGVGFILWRRHVASLAASDTQDTTQQGTQSPYANPETIVPVNQGLSQRQYQDILDAISKIQGPASTAPGGTGTNTGDYHYAVKESKLAKPESAVSLVTRFSDSSVASKERIASAVALTAADPRNLKYFPGGHIGTLPAGADVWTHVVKAGKA